MFEDEHQFEDEVRRVARLLWPTAQFGGAAMEYGRERDGIFETADFVHIVECTTSRKQEKAREDSTKIAKLIRKFIGRYPTKFVKGWFITQDEPSADQRTAVKEITAKDKLQPAHIVALSFDQFRGLLVDARSYLDHRKSFPFGSVRNPSTGEARFDPQYVPLQLLDDDGNAFDVDGISQHLLDGNSCVMVGEYGGKELDYARGIFQPRWPLLDK